MFLRCLTMTPVKLARASVLGALKNVGFTGWIILEIQPTDNPLVACRMSLEFLRRLL